MFVNVNCLHITHIVINEMPIFIAMCHYTVYCKMNEINAILAIQSEMYLLIQIPIQVEDET